VVRFKGSFHLSTKSLRQPRTISRLLALAAVWHIGVVLAVFLVAQAQLAPQTFDRNGIGVSFAIDSHYYRIEAEDMAKLLWQGRIRDWAGYNASFHVKLYSLSFALAGRLVGNNILAAEPLNLLYYLFILALTYGIAREAFDRNVAVLASAVVAFWPSLLLHTTQLLRDALFIPALLLLMLSLLVIVNRKLSIERGILMAMPGTLGALVVWLCRGDSWEIVVGIIILGAVIFAVAQIKEKQFSVGGTLAIALMLLLTVCIPRLVPTYRQSNTLLATSPTHAAGANSRALVPTENPEPPPSRWDLSRRVGLLRHKFITRYPLAGSNIDTDVELRDTADVLRYLPRAALIGFFAPFPNSWVKRGEQVGLPGRLMAGAEMLFMYAVMCLAGFALVKYYRRLSVWLLLGISSAGCIALGCVVVNISTLYRMRYAYFILIIILGMKGWLAVTSRGGEQRASVVELA